MKLAHDDVDPDDVEFWFDEDADYEEGRLAYLLSLDEKEVTDCSPLKPLDI